MKPKGMEIPGGGQGAMPITDLLNGENAAFFSLILYNILSARYIPRILEYAL